MDSPEAALRLSRTVLIGLALVCGACGASPTAPNSVVRLDFDFNQGPLGWVAGLADYSDSYGPRVPTSEYRSLPAELDASRRGLYILTGGEGVFSFYKGRVTALRPQTSYKVSFEAEIATNTSNGCVGAGGPPGEGTLVKAGASAVEPVVVRRDGWYRMNIDKGAGATGGADALLIGNIANSVGCQRGSDGMLVRHWEFKGLTSGGSTLRVQSAADGSLWFLVGTDQSFFSGLELYYTRFTATLTPD